MLRLIDGIYFVLNTRQMDAYPSSTLFILVPSTASFRGCDGFVRMFMYDRRLFLQNNLNKDNIPSNNYLRWFIH